jgi:uncharacterized membrane protein YdfJ with MMPL/SSD domain
VSVALIIAAGAQALLLRPTFADKNAIPTGFESRQVDDVIDSEFVPHLNYPIDVLLHPRTAQGGLSADGFELREILLTAPGVERVGSIVAIGRDESLIQVISRSPPFSASSQTLVRAIRGVPLGVGVGGKTAEFMDLRSSIAGSAWLAITIAAVATLLVLVGVTRSLVLPLKTVVFNAISIAAVVGLMVLVFQDRVLGIAGVLAYDGPSALDITSTVVVVAIALGLATDYSVLLLSRIVEEHRADRSDDEAVAVGMQRTGPVITRAALLLSISLLVLVTSRIFLVKQLTVGLAVGVLLDATIVRMLLVPSFMRLLGRRNWWAPAWLRTPRSRRCS